MNRPSNQRSLSTDKSKPGSGLFYLSVMFAMSVWLVDPFIDSFVLGIDSFHARIFEIDAHEMYMRSVISALFLLFGYFSARYASNFWQLSQDLTHYREILTNTTDRMGLVDKQLRHMNVNTAYAEAFGKSVDEVVGTSLEDLFGAEFFSSVLIPHIDRCLSGQMVEFKTWFDQISGDSVCLRFVLMPCSVGANAEYGIVLNIRDFTEKQIYLRKIRESETRFRMLVENAPVCIHEVNREGQLISMNEAGLRMMNLKKASDVYGMPYLDVVTDDEKADIALRLKQAWQGSASYFEFKAEGKSGFRYYDSSFIPIKNSRGVVESVMGVTQNQTERVLNQQAIQKSEAHLRFLYENNPSMYFTLSAEGVILSVNQFGAESLGYRVDELIGQSVAILFGDDAKREAKVHLDNCLASPQQVYEWEIPKRHKDGHQIIVKESSCAVQSPEGETWVLIVCRDITEMHQAEQKLKASEARYRAVVEDMPALVCSFFRDGKIAFVNRAYCQCFQTSEEELLGKNFMDLIPESDRLGVSENIASLTPENSVRTHEHQVIMPDGRLRWQRWSNRAIFDNNGAVVIYQALGEDVTERKESQFALLRRTNQLVENQQILLQLAKQEFPDAAQGFGQIVSVSAKQMGIGQVGVWLYDDARSQMTCHALSTVPNALQHKLIMKQTDYPAYFRALEDDYVAEEHARTAAATLELKEPYLVPNNVFSLLDIPIRVEGRVVGIVCHEVMNEPRDWSVEDIEFAKSIADLCALVISSSERKKLENMVGAIHQTTQLEMGEQYFHKLTQGLGRSMGVRYAFVGRLLSNDLIETISVWSMGDWVENFSYELAGTPCKNVTTEDTCIYPSEVTAQYPDDQLLQDMGVESYLGTPLRTPDGRVIGLLVVLDDKPMTETHMLINLMEVFAERASSELQRQDSTLELQKLSRAVESSSSAFVITDPNGQIEYVNPAFTNNTGYSKSEVEHHNISEFRDLDQQDDQSEEIRRAAIEKGEWKGELRHRKKDGTTYWDRLIVSVVRDHLGQVCNFIYIQEDVTRELELSEQLNHQATHDALTGLINRIEFEHRMSKLIISTQKDHSEHVLCFFDLDQFKVVNDSCGHAAGDELLRQIVRVVESKTRKMDILARIGGDEFAVLMCQCTLEQATRVAESLQRAIQEFQFAWGDQVFRLGVSIGLVPITDDDQSYSEVFNRADAACYMAKDLGRNRIHVYHSSDDDLVRRHGEMQWVGRIHKALNDDRFILFAQPIEPLGISKKKGPYAMHYELLVRMLDEDGKLIPPGAFLPAAERYQLMPQLDAWVIRKAFQYMVESPNFLQSIHSVSINLSGQTLATQEILDLVVTQIQSTGVSAEKVCFEITETAAISNLNKAKEFIAAIRELGCKFSLDDFGSGLSSFAYLKNLRVDFLKIDGMFVRNIVTDSIDHAMVKSINEIGQVMGMQTIAEFVENDEIKGMLREIGIDYAQGYGIGHPEPMDLIVKKLNNVHYLTGKN